MGTGCFAVFCLKRSEPAATGMQPCWLTLQQHPGDSEEEMGKVKKRRVKKKTYQFEGQQGNSSV